MSVVIIILASLIPGVLWVWFFHSKDRFEKEPLGIVVKTFIFGALAVIPAALYELPFRSFIAPGATIFTYFWVSFFVIGLGEEFFKFLAIYFSAYHSSEFNEPVDAIVYAVTAGLGFSVVENMLYTATFGIHVAPVRAVIASLAHASFSGLIGVYMGRAKFGSQPKRDITFGLILAASLHGLYDFILLSHIASPLFSIALVGVLYYYLRHQIDEALSKSPFQED